jgi:hypothetical protein
MAPMNQRVVLPPAGHTWQLHQRGEVPGQDSGLTAQDVPACANESDHSGVAKGPRRVG